jgi:uncharacterized membrane-anchored protein YjiN (DUF445 family)
MSDTTKHIAGFSLGVMGIGFLATMPFEEGALGLLQGGFEAGVVGGLADWFAVTALFRHPLGIPIPHTAIIPKNRIKLTQSVISMLESELLNKDSIRDKIDNIHMFELLLNKTKNALDSEAFKKGIETVLEVLIQQVPADKISIYVEHELKRILDGLDQKSILQTLINKTIDHQYDEKAFDILLDRAEQWIVQDETRQYLGAIGLQQIQQLKLNGLMQFALNAFTGYLTEEKVGTLIQTFIMNNLIEYKLSGHPKREKILVGIRSELSTLTDNPALMNEITQWKNTIIEKSNLNQMIGPYIQQSLERLLLLVRSGVIADDWAIPFVKTTLNQILQDPEMIRQGEHWIHNQIVRLIENNYSKIGELVQENLNMLDNKALIAIIEGKLGQDLNWIRVNGAICGFLVGILLSGIKILV